MRSVWSRIFFLSLLGFSFCSISQAAILIEQSGRSVSRLPSKQAQDSFDFKRQRKVGFGLGAAGIHGLMGAILEINFSAQDSLAGNFGLGSDFQSFGLRYRRSLGGQWFSPYFGAAFSRWYTTGGPKGNFSDSSPGFLSEKFLTESEVEKGQFAKSFLSPSFGFQYNQLKGEWSGLSIYVEVLMLIELENLVSAATGELGAIYYF